MSLQQEVYDKIHNLPDDSARLIIALIDRISVNSGNKKSGQTGIKMVAFREMEKRRAASPFPKDVDYDKIREEAMTEKYESLA